MGLLVVDFVFNCWISIALFLILQSLCWHNCNTCTFSTYSSLHLLGTSLDLITLIPFIDLCNMPISLTSKTFEWWRDIHWLGIKLFFAYLQFSSVSFSNPAPAWGWERLLMYGGIIQIFNGKETAVPILPYEAWICTLHQISFNKPVAATVLCLHYSKVNNSRMHTSLDSTDVHYLLQSASKKEQSN